MTPLALRAYQREALDATWQALCDGLRSVLMVAATGTGKTRVAIALASRWLEDPTRGRVLILAGRGELVDQAASAGELAGLLVERERGPERSYGAPVVVGTVQTLCDLVRLARAAGRTPFGLIIVDEAHHAVASTYRSILDALPGARVVGVTATPDRADGRALGEVFQHVSHTYGVETAIAAGYLTPLVRCSATSVEDLVRVVGDRRTIVFASGVEVSRSLTSRIEKLNFSAVHVDGTMPSPARRAALAAFSGGSVQFLCNDSLVTEGWDVPGVGAVAIMRSVGSRALRAQMAGRGMRLADGKSECLLVELPGTAELLMRSPRPALAAGYKARKCPLPSRHHHDEPRQPVAPVSRTPARPLLGRLFGFLRRVAADV